MKRDGWVVNRDGALVLRDAAGIWPGCWKVGRHTPKPEVAQIFAMTNAIAGTGLPTGPYDIVRAGYLAAIWNPYERVGRFETVREAKAAVEQALRARERGR